MKNIREKLSLIQNELKVKKKQLNGHHKYYYRSAEDILEAIKPILSSYNVYFVIDESVSLMLDMPIIKSTARIVCCENGEFIEVSAVVAVDLNQKAQQKPQQFGAASSYGKKYALGNLLLIDDTDDADATNVGESPKDYTNTIETIKSYKLKIENSKDSDELKAIGDLLSKENQDVRNGITASYINRREVLKNKKVGEI